MHSSAPVSVHVPECLDLRIAWPRECMEKSTSGLSISIITDFPILPGELSALTASMQHSSSARRRHGCIMLFVQVCLQSLYSR